MGHGTVRALFGRAFLLVGCLGWFAVVASSAQAYVYWTDAGAHQPPWTTLGRVNLDGKGEVRSLVDDASGPIAIATSGTYVYWANSSATIGRVHTNGIDPNPRFLSLPGSPGGLAVAGGYLYWTWTETSGNTATGYIGRANVNGSDVNPEFVDLGNEVGGNGPQAIAVSDGTLFVGELGQVIEILPGGSPSPFVTTIDPAAYVEGIAVADGDVFWSEVFGEGTSDVAWAPISDPSEKKVFLDNVVGPWGVASNGTYLYWADIATSVSAIGRALITQSGPANIDYHFVSDSRGPAGVAVDSDIDPTTTSVSCSPSTVAVGSPTVCTAAVGDRASSEKATGTVSFSGTSSTFFPGGNTCTLTARPGGVESCTVGAESSTAGTRAVTAVYAGNTMHHKSVGSARFCAGSTSTCSPISCHVPQLIGKRLSKAQQLLTAAHCDLGSVTRPKHVQKGETLVVGSQSPVAGRVLPKGSRVSVRMVRKT
jgi:hypothetical protein